MPKNFNPETQNSGPEQMPKIESEGKYPVYILRNELMPRARGLGADKIEGRRIIIVRDIYPGQKVGDRIDIAGLETGLVPTKIVGMEKVSEGSKTTNSENYKINFRGNSSYIPIRAKLVLERIKNDK